MEISRDITLTLINKAADIQSMDIEYNNGEVVSGFARKISPSPLKLLFQEHETSRGEDKRLYHINFTEVKSVTIFFNNGTQGTFE